MVCWLMLKGFSEKKLFAYLSLKSDGIFRNILSLKFFSQFSTTSINQKASPRSTVMSANYPKNCRKWRAMSSAKPTKFELSRSKQCAIGSWPARESKSAEWTRSSCFDFWGSESLTSQMHKKPSNVIWSSVKDFTAMIGSPSWTFPGPTSTA